MLVVCWSERVWIFLEDIKTKQLKWSGHVQRMEEGRLPKKKL